MAIISPLPVLSEEEVLETLNNIEELPTLPVIVNKIIETLGDPETSVRELSDLIKIDQAMSMQILRVSNSAFYGLRSKVTNLDRGIMILGFEEIKRITMSAYIIKSLPNNLGVKNFRMHDFWKHSIGVAYCAKFIAEKIAPDIEDEAYTAGLLHDIGKLIISQFFPKYFLLIVHYVSSLNYPFSEVEEKILGTDHSIISKWLAVIWGLPVILRESMEKHHTIVLNRIPYNAANKLPHIIALANLLNNKVNSSDSGRRINIPFDLYKDMGMTDKDIEKLSARLIDARAAIESYFE